MMIVPGHISDIIEIMRIEMNAFKTDGYDITTLQHLITNSISFLKMVNPIDMKMVGFSICSNMMGDEHAKETQAVELITLAIHPAYQGNGFGKRLLQRTMDDLRRFGVRIIQLHVRVSNEAAINLYTKFGFKIAETQKHYYDESKEDAHVMIARLTNISPS